MGNLVHVESWKTQGRSNAVGLAPVACYDPYFHRMVHHLRKCLVDGHPVLARLHPAAQYPVEGSDLYSVDLEGHAVLIVGYDDERRIFAISDPWDRRWGGQLSGLRWIGYDELSLNIVDSTLDYVMVLAPLQVDVRAVEEASAKAIEIDVGFYEPAAIVMDRDTQEVREVGVELRLPIGWGEGGIYATAGSWKVGERARLRVPAAAKASGSAEIIVVVTATIAGSRPYPYVDRVHVSLSRSVRFSHIAGFAVG